MLLKINLIPLGCTLINIFVFVCFVLFLAWNLPGHTADLNFWLTYQLRKKQWWRRRKSGFIKCLSFIHSFYFLFNLFLLWTECCATACLVPVNFIHVNLMHFIHKHFPCLYLFSEKNAEIKVLTVVFTMNKNHLIAKLFLLRPLLPGQNWAIVPFPIYSCPKTILPYL